MTTNPFPHALTHLARIPQSVLTARQLREHGITPAVLADRCRPGGPWRQLLPQVYLLHPGTPSGEERVRAALLYSGGEGMVTGPAALALYRFSSVPPLPELPRIDVLVPRQRRLRDAGDVAVHRARELPLARDVAGLPCAPVPRAIADAVAEIDDTDVVRVLFTEAVRGGHCEAPAVVHALEECGLLERPYVTAALDALRAEGRARAEESLYAMVRDHALPDPVWNVDLRLPGGPPLGGVDAYWPEHAVAIAVAPCPQRPTPEPPVYEDGWARHARQRERLEALGITLVHLTAGGLAQSPERQAAVVRTALTASSETAPAAYVVVTPR